MFDPYIDTFVSHLKRVVETSGFDFDCLEDKSKEEALEILEKQFGSEAMWNATQGSIQRILGPMPDDQLHADAPERPSAPRELDAEQDRQPVEGIGKAA